MMISKATLLSLGLALASAAGIPASWASFGALAALGKFTHLSNRWGQSRLMFAVNPGTLRIGEVHLSKCSWTNNSAHFRVENFKLGVNKYNLPSFTYNSPCGPGYIRVDPVTTAEEPAKVEIYNDNTHRRVFISRRDWESSPAIQERYPMLCKWAPDQLALADSTMLVSTDTERTEWLEVTDCAVGHYIQRGAMLIPARLIRKMPFGLLERAPECCTPEWEAIPYLQRKTYVTPAREVSFTYTSDDAEMDDGSRRGELPPPLVWHGAPYVCAPGGAQFGY